MSYRRNFILVWRSYLFLQHLSEYFCILIQGKLILITTLAIKSSNLHQVCRMLFTAWILLGKLIR